MTLSDDQLIDALRARIADPEKRVDSRPSQFMASVQGMSLMDLFSSGRQAVQDALRASSGQIDDGLLAKAQQYATSMSTPASNTLPPRATPEAVATAEATLGFALPALLRRLYLEVANGGFGPGEGLIGVAGGWTDSHGHTLVDLYRELSSPNPEPPDDKWPDGLLAVVDFSGIFGCVDTRSPAARIVEWDAEESDYGGWDASFKEVSPSLGAWLSAWVRARPAHEVQREEDARMLREAEIKGAREARAAIAKMSLDERRALGLPDEGWEKEVWGGIGLDADE